MISLSPKELYQFLKSKGIDRLYYANTVKNSCSMLTCGELMSNHQLNYRNFPMTDPINPSLEKEFCMWNKISFYTCDLHGYFSRQNRIGPVCFAIDIDFLLELHEKDLYISKRNPMYRKKGMRRKQICYSSVNEFAETFNSLISDKIAHKNIILVRDKNSAVDLRKYLVEITLDQSAHRYMLFTKAQNALKSALKGSGISQIPLKIRECKKACFCQANYDVMTADQIERLFLP